MASCRAKPFTCGRRVARRQHSAALLSANRIEQQQLTPSLRLSPLPPIFLAQHLQVRPQGRQTPRGFKITKGWICELRPVACAVDPCFLAPETRRGFPPGNQRSHTSLLPARPSSITTYTTGLCKYASFSFCLRSPVLVAAVHSHLAHSPAGDRIDRTTPLKPFAATPTHCIRFGRPLVLEDRW